MFGLSVGTAVFVQYHLQSALDDVALAAACQLNSKMQIGQMNDMIARCRQLVYSARQTDVGIAQQKPALNRLSTQLLNEARNSAASLEQSRASLVASSKSAATQASSAQFAKTCAQQSLVLPWLKMSKPVLTSTQFGWVNNVDSSETVGSGIPDLLTFDQTQNIIDAQPNLYKQNINAKLPAPDNDLNFNVSSLPAYTNSMTTPARLLLGNAFTTNGPNNQLASTVQVTAQVQVSTGLGPAASHTLTLVSTATTFGAGPVR